jgi:deazaflavin-dependent oxidoreductase (nitroreductase family)
VTNDTRRKSASEAKWPPDACAIPAFHPSVREVRYVSHAMVRLCVRDQQHYEEKRCGQCIEPDPDNQGPQIGKEARSHILPYFYRDYTNGETYGVIGSNGGAPDHPHWVYNLVHEPMCEVRVGRRKFNVRAHMAEGEEHDRVYGTAVRSFPWFQDYEVRCFPRKIRAVVLEKI